MRGGFDVLVPKELQQRTEAGLSQTYETRPDHREQRRRGPGIKRVMKGGRLNCRIHSDLD